MPAYKYKKGGKIMWFAKINFQDADGVNCQHCKRGFSSKKDDIREGGFKAYSAVYTSRIV